MIWKLLTTEASRDPAQDHIQVADCRIFVRGHKRVSGLEKHTKTDIWKILPYLVKIAILRCVEKSGHAPRLVDTWSKNKPKQARNDATIPKNNLETLQNNPDRCKATLKD